MVAPKLGPLFMIPRFQFSYLLLLDLLVVLERLSLPVPVDLNLILVVGTISVRHLRLVDLGVSCLTNLRRYKL